MRAPRSSSVMTPDARSLDAFVGKLVADLGATLHAGMAVLGDQLGLYKALASAPMTSIELATATGTDERYVREWLASQAAGGYVEYDPATARFSMNAEQSAALANGGSPIDVAGAFRLALGALRAVPRLAECFRSGAGFGWHEHDASVFRASDRVFAPACVEHLSAHWIASLEGVAAKLDAGARVADVGCGLGTSTIPMAQAFPRSRFRGFDYHAPSIDAARAAAARARVQENVAFDVATAKAFPGRDYDLVVMLDCLHDVGDPVGAAAHVHYALARDGTWMIVEPFAHDDLERNFNPVGRVFYSVSTLVCTPASRSQEVGACLGAQAGEARLRDVARQGGFLRFRRVAQTAWSLVFEARP